MNKPAVDLSVDSVCDVATEARERVTDDPATVGLVDQLDSAWRDTFAQAGVELTEEVARAGAVTLNMLVARLYALGTTPSCVERIMPVVDEMIVVFAGAV